MARASSDDFSVVVVASDLGIDALQFLRLERGADKSGNRIFRIVGKYFTGEMRFCISCDKSRFCIAQKLRRDEIHIEAGQSSFSESSSYKRGTAEKYVFNKIFTEIPEGPYCIVYMNSTVQTEDDSPGLTILRWTYEELPSNCKDRLHIVYFVHPWLHSRLFVATLGRFFFKWRIRYVSRLHYLWEDVKKGEIEIPEFVYNHDDVLEHRPLTDYGIEPDPLHLTGIPSAAYSLGSSEGRWASRDYIVRLINTVLIYP